MSALQDLRAAVGWSAPAADLDWAGIEEAVGLRYPAEYKELCSTFPPGEFQSFLKVLHPSASADAKEHGAEVAGYAKLLRDDAEFRGFPYPIYPSRGGVVPWATIGFDYVICWLADGAEPDDWRVIVCDSRLLAWHVTGLRTGDFMRAMTTVPSGVPALSYVAEARQPPTFVPMEPAGETAARRPSSPRTDYWLEGETVGDLAEPFNAVEELRSLVTSAPAPGIDRTKVLQKMGRSLPVDYLDVVNALGGVAVGPARVSAPDGSDRDFFKEVKRLRDRVAKERAAGGGPIGTIHPETDGLITWGRLEGGGYLCWVPESGSTFEWPVIVLDESLRFSVVYHMSASRFLLELATHPERIALPPAL